MSSPFEVRCLQSHGGVIVIGILRTVYGQLADKPTRRQSNSPTNKLAEIAIIVSAHAEM